MKYVSTRGQAATLGFADVLLAGLAPDGGLYVPENWPKLSTRDISAFAGQPYADVAFAVVRPFVGGDIPDSELRAMCRAAYAGFSHPAVAPLTELAPDRWALELFHGPTLAFKDLAMQLLARLMDHVLARRGSRITIVGATSGDTGAAAIEAFRGRDNIDVFILFPEGRVSPMQQRQMTTVEAPNVHALAVKGTFDDCQAILKQLFADPRLRSQLGLAGVNSINWARIVGQIVYYFTAAVALGGPARPVGFTVPTGNFGDIFAGYAAKRMGLPVERLTIATNVNDILVRTLQSGRYEVRNVVATASPSMDIQVSSNFERLLFEACGRDADRVRRSMERLAQSGAFDVDSDALTAIRADFSARSATEAETAEAIRKTYAETGFLADPHTAVGLSVARRLPESVAPNITLATAHPAKFAAAVKAATGIDVSMPESLAALSARRERFATLPNDMRAVAQHISALSRAAAEKV
jgi:threonine synthase